MRIDIADKRHWEITLSKRNLLALLGKVDREDSNKTLEFSDGYVSIVVRSEPDKSHYEDRIAPGVMDLRSETFIAENAETRY